VKFNEGDRVIVTGVPPKAKWYVLPGTPGVIAKIEHAESAKFCSDFRLTKVVLNGFAFYWSEKDLEPAAACCGRYPVSKAGAYCADKAGCHAPIKLTIIDEGRINVARKVSRQTKHAFSYGYDPYNTVHAHLIYMRLKGVTLHEAS